MATDEERFVANLKSLREARHMTQAVLAANMSDFGFRWHQATVYKIENNERQIQLGEAVMLAKLFDVKLDDMLKENDELEVDEHFRTAIRSADRLGSEARWKLLDAANELVQAVKILDARPDVLDGLDLAEEIKPRPTNSVEYLQKLAQMERESPMNKPRIYDAEIDSETRDSINAVLAVFAENIVGSSDDADT